MLRALKTQLLEATRATGLNRRVSNTEWRRNKCLILCYHGISQDDEHAWNPAFFMSAQTFESRLETLKEGQYNVLPLSEAFERLAKGSLPPRSVVLTFDDGMTNFRTHALPILRKYHYPATVYLRTDYCYYRRPVFRPVGPYLLWKRRQAPVSANQKLGWLEGQDLRTEEGRARAWSSVERVEQERQLSYEERDALLAELANHIGIDYQAFLDGGILQIMSPEEVSAIAREGTDIQLHTHSHQLVTDLDQEELRTDIEENRRRIVELTGTDPVHFCYPNGKYSPECLPTLRDLGIATATTCEPALTAGNSNPLLLPRYIDTDTRTPSEFEAWLSGVGGLLPRLRARQNSNGN